MKTREEIFSLAGPLDLLMDDNNGQSASLQSSMYKHNVQLVRLVYKPEPVVQFLSLMISVEFALLIKERGFVPSDYEPGVIVDTPLKCGTAKQSAFLLKRWCVAIIKIVLHIYNLVALSKLLLIVSRWRHRRQRRHLRHNGDISATDG